MFKPATLRNQLLQKYIMSKSTSSESANYMTSLLRSVIVTLSGDDGSSSGMAYDSIDLSDYEGSGENFATNLTATVHTPLNSAGMIKILHDFRNQTACMW